jgi:hypothetical protein
MTRPARPLRALLVSTLFLTAAPSRGFAQAAETGDVPALTRALDSIRAERIVADVAYVACDDMGGRDTPSVGQRLTARFIKNRLQRIGWKPGAGRPGAKDPFLYGYPLLFKRMKEPDTHALLEKGEQRFLLTIGSDYWFAPPGLDNQETKGGIVFCGGGSKGDFAAAPNARGHWALCVDDGGANSLNDVDERARAAGAIGVLAVLAADAKAPSYAEAYGRFLPFLRNGRAQALESAGDKRATTLPKSYLSPLAAEKIWELAGTKKPELGAPLGITFTDTRKLIGDGTIECEDVVGFWPGSDPTLSKEVILCSAHYDHLGTAADGTVYNGADDNASGTSALLALSEALVVRGPLRRSVMLIWVSGEEKGLYGSAAWCKAPFFPNDGRAIADINIEMVGRNAPNQILLTPTRANPAYNGLVRIAEQLAPGEGFTDVKSADEYYTRSDHAMFAKLNIPVVFLFDDVHADYHKPTDKVEKIDGDKIRRVTRLVLRMVNDLQVEPLDFGK